jgi:hypothetical protein
MRVFANAELKATEKLTLEAGLRYDMDSYSGYQGNSQFFSQNLDNSSAFNYNFASTTADNSMTTTEGPFYYWKYNVKRLVRNRCRKLQDQKQHGCLLPLQQRIPLADRRSLL